MSKEKLTTEEFLKNEDYTDALFAYGKRQGKTFGTKTKMW